MSRRYPPSRPGFTMVELVVAMALAALLVGGMTSTLFLALRASSNDLAASRALEGSHVVMNMTAELQYAVTITEQTATAITVTVPDRDEDTFTETIRYAWSGTSGDPLTRQYNGGTVATVAEDVHDFDLQYRQPAAKVYYATVRLQISSDDQTTIHSAIPFVNRPE